MASAREILLGLEQWGIRLGLEHLRELAAALGHPERATPAVIVAGTNGKGSVSALLASIAEAAGLRTGLYTSPHLERVEERIRVGGREIDAAALGDLLQEVLAAAARLGHASPTYFEAMTLGALLQFARQKVDLSVLEVGMGGRLDATNLADGRLAVVTAIALDHQEFLGSTLDAIAREKAGVLRTGQPAVFSPQLPDAARALADEAGKRGARALDVGDEVVAMAVRFRGLAGLGIRLTTRQRSYELESALSGRHQAWNVATAVVAAEQFAAAGLPTLPPGAIVAGVAACRWPGRLEALPVPGAGTTVLLDAAHNPAGCKALVEFLDELDRPFTLLFGALADKDLGQMLPDLAARASRVVLTRPASPRAADPATLAALVPAAKSVRVEARIEAALELALADEPARPAPPHLAHLPHLVVACGSIFLIGELRTILLRSRPEPSG
ncbi:MAG: bifunctional folylpolyglutamate synthase/dihydrofolate synthase [Thermoanaerobaculia bacterium]|nr:bifunctional folylpolyglutamate synthase/dihydrofolate synthase [Thermoanaerobaculia bacterium]MBP9824361.1 bifunctional folylpolyglutamate synthase/dihydrofolate synthase [Thermoanaerobaculia bacterium]